MKLAIVHDDFLQWGGAERVVAAMCELWPNAPVFTSITDPNIIKDRIKNNIIQSRLQVVPFKRQLRRTFLLTYPLAFQQFDLKGYDVILSSSTRFAHTIKTQNGTTHISYCHAPPRFLWQFSDYVAYDRYAPAIALLTKPWLRHMQVSDQEAIKNVSYLIANSENVAKKIKRIYGREANIIHPFVDTKKFTPKKTGRKGDYFIAVSRLLPWKRIDIAIAACKKLRLSLVIVGKGPDETRLKKIAQGSRTTFLADLTDQELIEYYRGSSALIMTQNEDFGLTALEAQACGKPVLAFGKGGALETVRNGVTGSFYYRQTSQALAQALRVFDPAFYQANDCTKQAATFSESRFKHALRTFVNQHH